MEQEIGRTEFPRGRLFVASVADLLAETSEAIVNATAKALAGAMK